MRIVQACQGRNKCTVSSAELARADGRMGWLGSFQPGTFSSVCRFRELGYKRMSKRQGLCPGRAQSLGDRADRGKSHNSTNRSVQVLLRVIIEPQGVWSVCRGEEVRGQERHQEEMMFEERGEGGFLRRGHAGGGGEGRAYVQRA